MTSPKCVCNAIKRLILMAIAITGFVVMTHAAPVNDAFINAIAIGGKNGSQAGSNVTATSEPAEPVHAGTTGGRSVWYRWTAPDSGRWIFRTTGSSFDTTLGIYTGMAVNALTEVVSNDDEPGGGQSSYLLLTAQAGAEYQVALDGYLGDSGTFLIEWTALVPANDEFAKATAITGEFGYRDYFNFAATTEPGEPNAGNSIWYRWIAPRSMQAMFFTEGSGFDTFLRAYVGSNLAGLTEITSNDNDGSLLTSRLSFQAVAGTEYSLQLTGVGGVGGDTRLRWGEAAVEPPRLLPDISIMASSTEGYLYGWTIDQTQIPGRTLLRVSTATPNTGAGRLELRGTTTSPLVVQRIYHEDGGYDERPAGSFTFHPTHGHLHFDDWVQLHLREVLPGNGVGDVIASGNKTSFAIIDLEPHDTTLPGAPVEAVYEGGLTQGISVGWRDVYTRSLPDQWIDVTAVPPGQYWLEGVVDPENHIEESDETNNANRILITYAGSAPPNNNFASATILTGSAVGTTGKTHLGSKETGEPYHAGNPGGKSIWYRWTASASGLVTLSTEGSDFDTLLAIYTGSAVGSLTAIASNDDAEPGVVTSKLTFSAVSGTVYRIALDGKNGVVGSCQLAINPAGNDMLASSRLLSGALGSVTGSSHGATQEVGEPAHAGTGGKSVWYTWTAPSAGEASFDTEGSAFDTVLAVYTGNSVGTLALVAVDDNGSLGNTSRVVFTSVPGTTYRIAVDGNNGEAGIHALNWTMSSSTMPYILTHPESANIPLGGTAVFNVVAGGSQPRQYQWWHNGSIVSENSRTTGSNTQELTIYKLQSSDSGSYHVVITNTLGTATSETATLIALANPRVIHADDVTADIGGVLSLPIGIQSQGNEHVIQCTVTLDPAIFLSPRVVPGPDAEGGTLIVDLSQTAAGRIGLIITLPGDQVLATGHREVAIINADVSPSVVGGDTRPAGFSSLPIPASAFAVGGAVLPAQTAASNVTLVRVIPVAELLWQGGSSVRVILRGLRGREYIAWRTDDWTDWLPFGQGMTDQFGIVEAVDPGAGLVTRRFYRWSLVAP